MYELKLYIQFIGAAIRSKMEYRVDFLTGVLSVIIYNAVNLTLIGILITQFSNLNGWNMWELFFLYSFWLLCHSIFSMFFWQFTEIDNYIIRGDFDQFLTKPMSVFSQFVGRQLNYIGVGDFLIALIFIIISYRNLSLDWDIKYYLLFLLFLISGILIETALACIIACISFWTGRSNIIFNVVMFELNGLVQRYPIDMFGKYFKVVVTYLIPMAFINYFPSMVLLHKIELGGVCYIMRLQ